MLITLIPRCCIFLACLFKKRKTCGWRMIVRKKLWRIYYIEIPKAPFCPCL